MTSLNKRKIINDPVYGFITIPGELVFDIIEHPFFQRLRRIKQLGLTHLVYPGALHTRFHHALGAMYLMKQAVDTLRFKGLDISQEEELGVTIAILLHDIGHGPFSHTLEASIVSGMKHEEMSELFMTRLNEEFDGALQLSIDIFQNRHSKHFLHQLVSSQLDMDRMDYLKRDSFFTGVSEGVINSDRIISMLNVANDEIVVEAKGIYSVEKFIVARRLMYWQVYFHKTVVAAEQMLVNILLRAKHLSERGVELFATPAFNVFLKNNFIKEDFIQDRFLLDAFSKLDDFDIYTSIKIWSDHPDKILSFLSRSLVNRRLFRIEMQYVPFTESRIGEIEKKVTESFGIEKNDLQYLFCKGEIANDAYKPVKDKINLLMKDGQCTDISKASAQLNVAILSETVTNYYICYPKTIL